MTPIEKNIIVVDEAGNEYEATYPKRARGLVKHGRARFIEPNKICLACPPNIFLEDNSMQNDNTPALTIADILQRLDKIHADTAHLDKAITALEGIAQTTSGDIAGKAKAEAMGDVVKCRETTNQQLIGLYKQMYEDIRGPSTSDDIQKMAQLRQVAEILQHAKPTSIGAIRRLAETMLGLPGGEDDDDDGEEDDD